MRPSPVIVIDHDRSHGEFVAAVLDAAGVDAIVVESDYYEPPRAPWRGAHHRREEIAKTIKTSAFRTVFQPMVALYKSETVGYEALTRFDDGTRPDQYFADANALGLGRELELATIDSAVEAARGLPRGRFVTINLSPELLLASREELGACLDRLNGRPVVLELTEHDVVEDYEATRASLAALGPHVQLSVDDAGAGFSTLRHVIMLEPEYVKLDRGWVSDIHIDPTRQALVAGLSHFARTTGCELVAEGIEHEAERATLQDLDVSLGQGFLLGPPDEL